MSNRKKLQKKLYFCRKNYCLSHRLEFADALIAATAIFHNANLFTLNRKDFACIPYLKLYEPK